MPGGVGIVRRSGIAAGGAARRQTSLARPWQVLGRGARPPMRLAAPGCNICSQARSWSPADDAIDFLTIDEHHEARNRRDAESRGQSRCLDRYRLCESGWPCAAKASTIGCIWRHGPHHDAEKSINSVCPTPVIARHATTACNDSMDPSLDRAIHARDSARDDLRGRRRESSKLRGANREMGQQVAIPRRDRSTPARATSLSPSRPPVHVSSQASFLTGEDTRESVSITTSGKRCRRSLTQSAQSGDILPAFGISYKTNRAERHSICRGRTPRRMRENRSCASLLGRPNCHPCSGPKSRDMHLACQCSGQRQSRDSSAVDVGSRLGAVCPASLPARMHVDLTDISQLPSPALRPLSRG